VTLIVFTAILIIMVVTAVLKANRAKHLAVLGLAVVTSSGVFGAVPDTDSRAASQAASAGIKQLFIDHCAACHGEDARGIKDQGANLVTSMFMKRSNDAEVAAFLKTGRQPDAPDSTMKLLMPAFDYLTDEELAQVIAFTRNPK
jgi:mono/diheme cytochrome c family protein